MDDLLDRAPCGYLAFGDDRIVTDVNTTGAHLLGYEREELVSKALNDILPVDTRIFFHTHLFAALALHGRADELYVSLRRKTVDTVPVLWNAIREEETETWITRCVFVPMHRRHVFEHELIDATKAAEQAKSKLVLSERLASLGTIAAGVGHEINNPLTYVSGNLELLERRIRRASAAGGLAGENIAEMLQLVAEAREGGDRIRAIVHTLRMLSRADDTRKVPTDVARVIEVALRMTRHDVRHRARVDLDLEPVPLVEGSESQLSQVVINLLLNAVQALPDERQHENVIRVATRPRDDGRVVLEVADNGPGIPVEIQSRLFEPFFTTKPVGSGTGLGLSICHSIVTSLGGSLEVESAPGEGALFRVVLPAAEATVRGDPS